MKTFSLFEMETIARSYDRMMLMEAVENFDHPPSVAELNPSMEKLVVDSALCSKWYALFNKWYFNGELPPNLPIETFQFTKDKKTIGFAYSKHKFTAAGKIIAPDKIEINTIYGFDELKLFTVLIHEMIHILDYTKFPFHYANENYMSHGAWFRGECARLGEYGWKISTYDMVNTRWSGEYFDQKLKKSISAGKVPLIGFVKKENGMMFITKTDLKALYDNIKGCIYRSCSPNATSKIESIEYYEIHGCEFATLKNETIYHKSRFDKDKTMAYYQDNGFIGDTPFYVYVPEENAVARSQIEQTLDHIEINKTKLVKGVMLAMSHMLYTTAYGIYEDYSGNPQDLLNIEFESGSYRAPGFRMLNGFPLDITVADGEYDDKTPPKIKCDEKRHNYARVVMKTGSILRNAEFYKILGDVIDDFEDIQFYAEKNIPSSVKDGDMYEYRNDVTAPKVIMERIKGNNDMVRCAYEIIDKFVSEANAYAASHPNGGLSESCINEERDEDDYDVGHHLIDDYARRFYDAHTRNGENVTVTIEDANTLVIGIE